MIALAEVLSPQCSVLPPPGVPASAMLVPNAFRARLTEFARIAAASHPLSVVGMAAKLEAGRVAAQLAARLLGAPGLDEAQAMRLVLFSEDFSLVWLRAGWSGEPPVFPSVSAD